MKKIISILVVVVALVVIVIGIKYNIFELSTGSEQTDSLYTTVEQRETTTIQNQDYKYQDVSDMIVACDQQIQFTEAPSIPTASNLLISVSDLRLYTQVTDEIVHGLSNNDLLHFTTKTYFDLETDYLASVWMQITNEDTQTHSWGLSSGRIYTFDSEKGFYTQNNYGKYIAAEKLEGEGKLNLDSSCTIEPGQTITVRCIFRVNKEYIDDLQDNEEAVYFVPCSTRIGQITYGADELKGLMYFVRMEYEWGN